MEQGISLLVAGLCILSRESKPIAAFLGKLRRRYPNVDRRARGLSVRMKHLARHVT